MLVRQLVGRVLLSLALLLLVVHSLVVLVDRVVLVHMQLAVLALLWRLVERAEDSLLAMVDLVARCSSMLVRQLVELVPLFVVDI
jgi:hypothetical protein